MSEGTIIYEVSYPDLDPDGLLANLLPNTMTLKFKDDKFCSELSAGMGMFKTSFIAKSKDHMLINTLKLANKKIATIMDQDFVNETNQDFMMSKYDETEETKTIMNYTTKKAVVYFNDSDLPKVDVYYTEDIKFNDPNWSLPFNQIPGFLLEYEMQRMGIRMKFTTKEIIEEDIDEALFELPKEYELVPYEEIKKEIDSLFETFES
jgi:GLPGLI family protein